MNIDQLKREVKTYYTRYLKIYNEKMQGENKTRFTASLYVILSLLALSFFGIFAISPTLSTVSGLNKQYEDDKLVDQALEQKLQTLRQLDIAYQQLIPDLQSILFAIPTTAKIPYLAREIENLAVDDNLTLVRLDFNSIEIFPAKKINEPLFSFTFNVILQGDQTDINKFIRDITNLDRIISIENISTNISDSGKFQLSFVGRAYFYGK